MSIFCSRKTSKVTRRHPLREGYCYRPPCCFCVPPIPPPVEGYLFIVWERLSRLDVSCPRERFAFWCRCIMISFCFTLSEKLRSQRVVEHSPSREALDSNKGLFLALQTALVSTFGSSQNTIRWHIQNCFSLKRQVAFEAAIRLLSRVAIKETAAFCVHLFISSSVPWVVDYYNKGGFFKLGMVLAEGSTHVLDAYQWMDFGF